MKKRKKPSERIIKEKMLEAIGGKILRTAAQETDIQILTERPPDMPIAEYRMRMRKQAKDIKRLLR